MKNLIRIKSIGCLLAMILVFNMFSIDSFAMSPHEVDWPDNFGELSIEEQEIWLTEHIGEGEYSQAEVVDTSKMRTPDENRIYYTKEASTTFYDLDNPVYGFNVKYTWSVDGRNPSTTVAIESVKVIKEIKNYTPVGGYRGPNITRSVNNEIGIGQVTVQTSFIYSYAGVIDVYQYATLHYHGGIHIIRGDNMTA